MNRTLDFANFNWGRILNSNNATQTLRKYLFRHAKGKSMVNFYIVNRSKLSKFRILIDFTNMEGTSKNLD